MTLDIEDIPWIPEDGIPEDWVSLFSKAFEAGPVDSLLLDFDSFNGSSGIREFARNNGFEAVLEQHLHVTKGIDFDMDCLLVEWHLSFPSEEHRVAWFLSMDHENTIQGWYE